MPHQKKAYLALSITSIVWGTTWVASKMGINHMPAFELASIRQFFGGSIYIIFFLLVKKEKLPKIKPEVVTIEPAKRGWLQPLPLPKEIELVSVNDIDPELRAEVSVFHEDGVAQFVRMMYKNYGIKKFTSATFKNSKYYFFYEEPMLAGRFNRKK